VGGEKGIKFCLQEETKFGKQFQAPYTHGGSDRDIGVEGGDERLIEKEMKN
jgi:hypothetical protein